jgi:putative resolvase
MKLSDYAKSIGITYRTAWNHFRAGKIPGAYQLSTGTITIPDTSQDSTREHQAAIYARVSSSQNRGNLDSQAERLKDYCAAKGYRVVSTIKEVGSGANEQRPKLQKLLADNSITSFVARYYGQRRAKRKTEAIIKELRDDNGNAG